MKCIHQRPLSRAKEQTLLSSRWARDSLLTHFFGLLALSLALLFGGSLLAFSANAQTLYLDEQFGFTRTTGVTYATQLVGSPATNMDLKLELFQPSGAGVPAQNPGLILIHGGGFVGGNRFSGRLIEICEEMAKRGWVCISIDYRLSGDDPVVNSNFQIIETVVNDSGESSEGAAIAAASEDAWAAFNWMIDNAGSLGVDPERIGIGGSSAGAVTALIVGYVLDDLSISAKGSIDAVFDMWGTLGDTPASIQADDPPLMIAHGEDDTTVSVSGAYALRDQSDLVGLPYEIHVFPDTGHGFNIFNYEVAPGESTFERFVSFFYVHVALETGVEVPLLSGWAAAGLVALLTGASIAQIQSRRRGTLRRASHQPTNL